MDTNKITEYQYEHASLLLPWYITGKLTASEKEEVEAILQISPKLQQELSQQQQLAQMVHDDPEVLDIVAITTQEQRLDSLLERINHEGSEQQDRQSSFWSQVSPRFIVPLMESFDRFLQPLSNNWARVAFALFFVVQVAILAVVTNKTNDSPSILSQVTPDGTTTLGAEAEYKLAEGSIYTDSNKADLVLQFTAQTTQEEIDQLFKEIGAYVIEHPEGSTNYTISLLGTLSENDIDSLIRRLEKNNKMIRLVGRGL
ncbi:MAG: hypothetical protein V3U78_10710 [Thiotrichaceae bacterium]